MLWNDLGLAVIMLWWSSHLRTWWYPSDKASRTAGEVEEVNAEERTGRLGVTLDRLRECTLATLGSAMIISVLLLFFGAPLDDARAQTFLLAVHLALLLVFPVVHTFGIPSLYDQGILDRYRLTRLFCEYKAESPLERTIVYPVIGTLVGAWCGVLPIPLDWDRPWQSYPLTPTIGSILGFIIGGYASWLHSALEIMHQDERSGSITSATAPTSASTGKKKKSKKAKAT
ncbi:GPI ethanolamine phosphate transferase 2/3 subunit F, partial [Tremellales sp. Uapishka_1]